MLFLRRHFYDFADLPDIFLHIFGHLKLELELPNKKLQDPILFDLLADIRSPVDGDAGNDPNEVYHIDGVDVGVIADMW